MDYGTYTGGIYPDNNNWARWVMDNMQGNIPDYGMPSPPPPARRILITRVQTLMLR